MAGTLRKGISFAVLAAALYAINAPFSKILLKFMPPTLMAGFLYIGAGIGMVFISLFRRLRKTETKELRLTRTELPFTIAMILLDIAAPIFLMFGLQATSAANAALLNNFEIVATSLIALMIFREAISPRLWAGILFVTLSCALLSFEDLSSLRFSRGSLLVLLAAVCWGFENNCTRKLSSKDPLEIVVIKGFGSGAGSLVIALALGERPGPPAAMLWALVLGFVAYGLSIFFYIYAQRDLGAAKTSAYYALAPFIGAGLSLLIFRQKPDAVFLTALVIMMAGTWLASTDHAA